MPPHDNFACVDRRGSVGMSDLLGEKNMSDIKSIREACSKKLDEIASYFTEDCKITLIVRKPGNDNADFVLSMDNLIEAKKVLARRLLAS